MVAKQRTILLDAKLCAYKPDRTDSGDEKWNEIHKL